MKSFLKKKSNDLCNSYRRLLVIIYFCSLFFLVAYVFIYYYFYVGSENFWSYFFSVLVIVLPICLNNLVKFYFNGERNYAYIEKVYTSLSLNKEIKRKYARAGISLGTDVLNKEINKLTEIREDESLDYLYDKIYEDRGVHDNFVRNLKGYLVFYFIWNISLIVLSIVGFPVLFNFWLVMGVKIYFCLFSSFIYKKLPFDTDIGNRRPRVPGILLGKEEIFLLVIQGFLLLIGLMIPYMYLLISSASVELVSGIFYTMLILMNVFYVFEVLSEKCLLVNMFKALKSLWLVIFVLFSVGLVFIINKVNVFGLVDIEIKNLLGCLVFAFFFNFVFDITKLARMLSLGGKRNEFKSNKKFRRS